MSWGLLYVLIILGALFLSTLKLILTVGIILLGFLGLIGIITAIILLITG